MKANQTYTCGMSSVEAGVRLSRRERIVARINPALWLVVLFSICYFAQILILSSEKYFWYDEFFTMYVARLGSVQSIWQALTSGVDFNPPLFYVITNASKGVFGETRLGMRLPEIIGFWIFCVSLFRFVERRTNIAAGFVAMVFPTLTGAIYYASDARPYGLLLGFCGLALVCWQKVIERASNIKWTVAFSAALAGGFLIHCYGLFLALPFVTVELVQAVRLRRWNRKVLSAVILPAVPSVLMHLPLVHSVRSLIKGTSFAELSPPGWGQIGAFYSFLLSPCMAVVIAVIVLMGFDYTLSTTSRVVSTIEKTADMMLSAAFLLLPALAVVTARAIHSSFFSRYCIVAAAGLSLTIGLQLGRRGAVNWLSLSAAILVGFVSLRQFGYVVSHRYHHRVEVLNEPSSGFSMNMSLSGPLQQYSILMPNGSDSRPIAVLEPLDFLYLVNYAPELRSRLYYVTGSNDDFFAPGFNNLRPWSPIQYNPPLTRDAFLHLQGDYLIYGSNQASQLAPFIQLGSGIKSLKVSNEHFVSEMGSKSTTECP